MDLDNDQVGLECPWRGAKVLMEKRVRVRRIPPSGLRSNLLFVNKRGNPKNLTPAHPGNLNSVKHGVYSSRLIEPRAAEIERDLAERFTFSAVEQLQLHEVARWIAILEAIDRALDEFGVVDRRGRPHDLLNHRARISGRLERWLAKISMSIDRQSSPPRSAPSLASSDLIRELELIAFGRD
jgi:hypothetical protein